MAQWAEVLAAKFNGLGSTLRTHMVKGEGELLKVAL